MSPTLSQAFADGRLLAPNPHAPDLVHVIRAIGSLCGVPGLAQMPATREMIEQIGVADHYLFVLLDGLGMNLIRKLPKDSFLVRHLRREIRAVCPSTTACALTSLATGHWPAQHGVTGWFTYLPEYRVTMTTLPFIDRFSQQRLVERGLSVSEVLPLGAMQKQFDAYQPTTLMPASILDTPYARYSRGNTPAIGYESISQAIAIAIAQIAGARGKTYTHLYIADVDARCHHVGTEDSSVMDLVREIDGHLSHLAAALGGRARIIVSADHGLIDVPVKNHMSLFQDDPLLELLVVPPSGDARLPVFHVHDGMEQQFADGFARQFGSAMELLKTDDAVEMQLFGPSPMSPVSRLRFGDFVGIATKNATLHYVPPRMPEVDKPREPYLAQHAGLSPAEMEIPLVIA